MTSEITIHHCKLNVVRRGGWSWGASREELVDKAVGALRALLERHLASLPIEEDREIRSPVRIAVPLTRREFLSAGSRIPTSRHDSDWEQRVALRVEQVLLPHLAAPRHLPEPSSSPMSSSSSRAGPTALGDGRPAVTSTSGSGSKLLCFLLRWRERGELGLYLLSLSFPTLMAWHRALFLGRTSLPHAEPPASTATWDRSVHSDSRAGDGGSIASPEQAALARHAHVEGAAVKTDRITPESRETAPGERAAAGASEMARVVQKLADMVGRADDEETLLRNRIVCAVEVAFRLKVAPCDPRVANAVDAALAWPAGLPLRPTANASSTAATETRARRARWSSDPSRNREAPAADTTSRPARDSHLVGANDQRSADKPTGLRQSPHGTTGRDAAGISQGGASDVVGSVETASARGEDQADPTAPTTVSKGRHLAVDSPTRQRVGQGPSPSVLPVLEHGERNLHSALPFLLLGPLSQLGYWEALEASFEAVAGREGLPVFDAALACKALEPLQRGWRRSPQSAADAAAFAGLEQPVPGSLMTEMARVADEFVSSLNAVVARAVLQGCDLEVPLVLQQVGAPLGDGLLLVDAAGCFPIAWSPDLAGLVPALEQCETSVLLIDRQTVREKLLAELDRRGLRFVTDAPPTRGRTLADAASQARPLVDQRYRQP